MRNPLTQLVNKTVIVTGAANGIGYETVKLLLLWKASVIAVDKEFDYDSAHWAEMPRGKVEDGDTVRFLPYSLDISNEQDVEQFWKHLTDTYDLDVYGLVNSAGISLVEWAERIDAHDFMEVVNTNLLGTFLMSREFIRHHAYNEKARGYVVNEGSLGSDQAFRGGAAYVSSKAGMKALTRQMAREQRGHMCFTCIQPETLAGPSKISEYVINRLTQTRGSIEAKEHRCGVVTTRQEAENMFRGTEEPLDFQTCEDIAKLTVFCLTDWAWPLSGSALQCLDGRT